jgi:glycosyltransferase involved in cell wall biosynthesis
MRVLWIINAPPKSVDGNDSGRTGGGWVTSLEAELSKRKDIQLGIVFKSIQGNNSFFTSGNTQYFPISHISDKNRFFRHINRWVHRLEDDDLLEKFTNVINEFKPDIIQIFGTESYYGLIISKINVPCVIHLQGSLVLVNHKWHSGLSVLDILINSKFWSIYQGWGFFHEYFFFKKAAKRELKIYNECSNFMGRTDWDKRMTSVLAPNAVYFHCDEILRQEFYLHTWHQHNSNNKFIIFSTSRDCTYKGLETVLECKKLLQKYYPESKITWKIAGVTENDEISYQIERKYKDSFVNNNVLLLGKLEEKELITAMLEADLFVHPSHIDNSPNTVCEAMLLGMPLITTYAGGIPSIIENNSEGLLVQDGDPYALAGAILELINDTKYAVKLGANARGRAIIRHNPDTIANRVLSIYKSVLSNK